MANLLKGLQYRELKQEMPNWRSYGTVKDFTEWTDCKDLTSFSTGTQFRVAPVFDYVVKIPGRISTIDNRDTAMGRVARALDEGHEVHVVKEEKATKSTGQFLTDNNIQYKTDGSGSWTSGNYFTGGYSSRVHFRIRPDTYFQVDIKTGIAQSTLNFDDVEELAKYVDKQLRTSDNNIFITRRNYGLTLSL
jgi:hypothetical protein